MLFDLFGQQSRVAPVVRDELTDFTPRKTLKQELDMRRGTLKAGATELDGLVLEDVPMAEPRSGEVRIKIHAVSLNYRDQFVLKGQLGSRLPNRDLVTVSDGGGEIDVIASDVTTWAIGDHVTGLYFAWLGGTPKAEIGFGLGSLNEDGMLSEYVAACRSRHARSRKLGLRRSRNAPCTGLTAWNTVFGDHPVGSDCKVLVLGSGSVSLIFGGYNPNFQGIDGNFPYNK
jgi:NADPH:quinone reductase-like Zn-dependent oxidoreductase